MMLTTNIVEFCQNYGSIDQKSISKLSILSVLCLIAEKSAYTGLHSVDNEYGGVMLDFSISQSISIHRLSVFVS